MKKITSDSNATNEKRAKTELDAKFMSIVDKLMVQTGITKDAAMSRQLGRSNEFINRVRNGVQSATPVAWSALFDKYPESRSISTTNVMAQGGGQAVGTVQGDNHCMHTSLGACQLELEQHKRDLNGILTELEKAQQQLADKDKLIASQEAVIASKDEIIFLLRGGYNLPNQ